MRGELDKLQEAVAKRLMSMGAFAVADIMREGAQLFEHGAGKGCGVGICVKIPRPLSASKYAAGPVFSRVALSVRVERDPALARHSPSLASLAENVSKALHGWEAPVECGYGKIVLSDSSPLTDAGGESGLKGVCVNFTAQSIIE